MLWISTSQLLVSERPDGEEYRERIGGGEEYYETAFADEDELFAACERDYGAFQSHSYIDRKDGTTEVTGWVFTKATHTGALVETWVGVCSKRPYVVYPRAELRDRFEEGDQEPAEAETYQWDTFSATMTAEGASGYETQDYAKYLSAWQYLIDTGLVWGLQGFFGRTARDLIEQGLCTMPEREDA